MKCKPWTLALIGAGLVSLPATTQAEEKPSSLLTGLSSTTLSGYVDTSAHWNPGTGNANLPPYTPNGVIPSSKADGFNLDVVALTLNKPVSDDWSAGYNATLLFGPDAVGYNTSFVGGTQVAISDFSLKDTYVQLHVPVGNGLDVKLGTYTEIIGYEVFEAGNNPNYTRSYGYELEPTQMTGVLATYTISPMWTAMFGVCDAWSAGVNARSFPEKAESFKTYMGMVTFTMPTNTSFLAGSTISAGAINGFNRAFPKPDGTTGANVTSYYAGGTFNTPVSGLKVGLAFDLLDAHGLSGENWAVGSYAAFQATEKLSFYGRAEYLKSRGEEKVFVAQEFDSAGAFTGFHPLVPDEVLALTLTAQYDLWKNVLSRLEVRWDHSLTGQGVWGGTTVNSGTEGTFPGDQKNAVLLAANIIYKF